MRLRSDIWVSAYIRRVEVEARFATLRRRGAQDAGAIFILVDRLDGRVALYSPGPADEASGGERRWTRAHESDWIEPAEAEARLNRELKFDPDIWIVEVESRDGTHWLDLASA